MKNILISILFLSNLCLAQVSVNNNPNFIAGQNTTQTLRKPGSTENGKVISWDNTLKKYNLITNSTSAVPSFLGSILNQTSFSNTTGYTSSTTVSASGGALHFSGGADDFTQFLKYNYSTDLENVLITAVFKATESSATSTGFGISKKSTAASYSVSSHVVFNTNSGVSKGQLNLYFDAGSPNNIASSTTNLTFSVNDLIQISYSYQKHELVVTASNLTTPSTPAILTFNYNLSYLSTVKPNVGNYSIINKKGTFDLNSFSIYSTDIKTADVLFLGDSKMVGYYVVSKTSRLAELLTKNFSSVTVSAGGGETTADILSKISEIITLAPKTVLLSVSNDIRYGISNATWQANLTSIISQLTTANINVKVFEFGENTGTGGIDVTPYVTWLKANYASNYIPVFELYNPSFVISDGVHPNDTYNVAAYNLILQNINGSANNKNLNFWNKATNFSDVGYTDGNVGIGNLSPSYLLDVNQTTNSGITWQRIFNPSTSANTAAGLQLQSNSITSYIYTTGGTYAGVPASSLILQAPTYINGTFGTLNNTFMGGTTTPTATLHLAAGSVSNPALKINSGSLLTTITGGVQDGAFEYNGTALNFIKGSTRVNLLGGITNTAANTEIAQSNGTNLIGSKMYVDTNGNLTVGNDILSTGDISLTAASSTLRYNFSLVSSGTISQKNIYISPPVINNSVTGNVSNSVNTFIPVYNLNLVDGTLINVTLYFSGIQTSGTLGASGFSYQVNATFRKSSNTWTLVGASNIISSANDTGDVFGTPTLTGGTGIDLNYSFNTTKTFAISFNPTYVKL